MRTALKLIIIVWLIGGVQAAMADEAGDAVQVLSNLWKGTFDSSQKGHITTEFVGDAKNFKMRWIAEQPDGTVAVLDGRVPFRFLEIAYDSLNNLVVSCVPGNECIYVRCLYKRDCVSVRQITYDPVYRDPKYQSITLFERPEASGAVKAADAESVRQALGTLIRLNASPPFEPPPPR